MKHFWLGGEHRFHTHMYCSGKFVFPTLSFPSNTGVVALERKVKSHFILCLFFHYLTITCFLFPNVCRPISSLVLTAFPQLPVAHLQEREQTQPPLWILGGVQIFSLLTSCFLLSYGIQNSAGSPDHTVTSARNISLSVLYLCVGGRI